jgi:hypothetical protein
MPETQPEIDHGLVIRWSSCRCKTGAAKEARVLAAYRGL